MTKQQVIDMLSEILGSAFQQKSFEEDRDFEIIETGEETMTINADNKCYMISLKEA